MTHESIDRFHSDLMAHYGVDPSMRHQRGVSVVVDLDRDGSGVASCYLLGEHAVVFTDPAFEDRFAPFDVVDGDLLEQYEAFAGHVGAEVLGTGIVRTNVEEPVAVDGVAVIDRDDPSDIARVRVLLDACDEDDVDEAEIDIDELDPLIRCTEAEPGGALTAYASAYPWENLAGRWDIGTLTHPGHRRRGLGRRALQRLTWDLAQQGHEAVYRHNLDNEPSARLAAATGYEVASRLMAIRFGDAVDPDE